MAPVLPGLHAGYEGQTRTASAFYRRPVQKVITLLAGCLEKRSSARSSAGFVKGNIADKGKQEAPHGSCVLVGVASDVAHNSGPLAAAAMNAAIIATHIITGSHPLMAVGLGVEICCEHKTIEAE